MFYLSNDYLMGLNEWVQFLNLLCTVHKFNTNKQKFIKWINTEEEEKKDSC